MFFFSRCKLLIIIIITKLFLEVLFFFYNFRFGRFNYGNHSLPRVLEINIGNPTRISTTESLKKNVLRVLIISSDKDLDFTRIFFFSRRIYRKSPTNSIRNRIRYIVTVIKIL